MLKIFFGFMFNRLRKSFQKKIAIVANFSSIEVKSIYSFNFALPMNYCKVDRSESFAFALCLKDSSWIQSKMKQFSDHEIASIKSLEMSFFLSLDDDDCKHIFCCNNFEWNSTKLADAANRN